MVQALRQGFLAGDPVEEIVVALLQQGLETDHLLVVEVVQVPSGETADQDVDFPHPAVVAAEQQALAADIGRFGH